MALISSADFVQYQNSLANGLQQTLTKSRFSPLCLTVIAGLPLFSETLKGQCFISRLTSGSSTLRPISRLASKTVFSGLEWYAFLALSPTLDNNVSNDQKQQVRLATYSRSSSVKLTHEGVIR